MVLNCTNLKRLKVINPPSTSRHNEPLGPPKDTKEKRLAPFVHDTEESACSGYRHGLTYQSITIHAFPSIYTSQPNTNYLDRCTIPCQETSQQGHWQVRHPTLGYLCNLEEPKKHL